MYKVKLVESHSFFWFKEVEASSEDEALEIALKLSRFDKTKTSIAYVTEV